VVAVDPPAGARQAGRSTPGAAALDADRKRSTRSGEAASTRRARRLHVMLKDRRDLPIARAVFDREMLIEMLNLLDDPSHPPTGATLQ
jgi:hypothetical protein